MKVVPSLVLSLVVGQVFLSPIPSDAQEPRRATRLGNPATRFAPPLVTTEDLRALFRNERLKPDIASILDQWGWTGNLDDLLQAAATHEVADVALPIGYRMPFMSSRDQGRPVCLRNLIWAGKEPAPAFTFDFSSNGRRYRCVTPKACSNFFLVDLGSDARPGLTVDCSVPARMLSGRPAKVCITVRNTGNVLEPKATVLLPIPEGGSVTRMTEGGVATDTTVTWEVLDLAPNTTKQVCAFLSVRELGPFSLNPTVGSASVVPVASACETTVIGIAAILLEVVDVEDPVEVGNQVTYVIKVTNQGSADGTRIRLVCKLPDGQEFVSGSGTTEVRAEAGSVTMEAISVLAPKNAAEWRVVVKALRAGDARFKAELSSDQFERPITEEESTQQY